MFLASAPWHHGRSHQQALLPVSSHACLKLASRLTNFGTVGAVAGAKLDFLRWQVGGGTKKVKPHITHREETQGRRAGPSLRSRREGAFQPPNSSHPSPLAGVMAGCGVESSKQ